MQVSSKPAICGALSCCRCQGAVAFAPSEANALYLELRGKCMVEAKNLHYLYF